MLRKKKPEKKFVVKYVPCVASAKLCSDCKGKGCDKCAGVGFLALIWEVHVAA
jgi:hypothetical protein